MNLRTDPMCSFLTHLVPELQSITIILGIVVSVDSDMFVFPSRSRQPIHSLLWSCRLLWRVLYFHLSNRHATVGSVLFEHTQKCALRPLMSFSPVSDSCVYSPHAWCCCYHLCKLPSHLVNFSTSRLIALQLEPILQSNSHDLHWTSLITKFAMW